MRSSLSLSEQLALSERLAERVRAFADGAGIPFAAALDRLRSEDSDFAATLRRVYGGDEPGADGDPVEDRRAVSDAVTRAHGIMRERNLSFGRALEVLRVEDPTLYARATRHYGAR
jgi:hypothetical protein